MLTDIQMDKQRDHPVKMPGGIQKSKKLLDYGISFLVSHYVRTLRLVPQKGILSPDEWPPKLTVFVFGYLKSSAFSLRYGGIIANVRTLCFHIRTTIMVEIALIVTLTSISSVIQFVQTTIAGAHLILLRRWISIFIFRYYFTHYWFPRQGRLSASQREEKTKGTKKPTWSRLHFEETCCCRLLFVFLGKSRYFLVDFHSMSVLSIFVMTD